MKIIIQFISITLLFFTPSCSQTDYTYSPAKGEQYLGIPVKDIEKELTSLLNCWYPALIDTVNGGYWTNLAYDWQLMDKQDKMLVTQARGLWTASRAATLFPDNPLFKYAADHGYAFLTQRMWDSKNSGFFQYYYIESKSGNERQAKTAYGNAFALYALSEYAKINKNPEVTGWIKKTFMWLENNAHDPDLKGYYNVILAKNARQDDKDYSMGDPNLKDQNSSIHLMEAFTNTFLQWPDSLLKERLTEIFKLIRDTMINKRGYLNLFFSKDWQPVSHASESRSYIMNNIYTDHVSFGHDIETAYLLLDACKTLYGKADSVTIKVARKLIDHSLLDGFDKDYYGLFDKGYYFKDKNTIEIVNNDKVWWSQAEAWHSLAVITQYYPQEKIYPQAFARMWTYINEQMIDRRYGGWYNNGLDTDPGNRDAPKGHQWKSCYHDGRALMEVYQYTLKQKQKN
jgi:cellobiose epimerase